MVGKWDADEDAKDVKTYETKEGAEWALDHILKKYLRAKGIKIDPTKPLDDAIDLVSNTLYYDIEFHKFALQNYRVFIHYDKENDDFHIIKLKED
jgi:hypothetical protein